MKWELCGPRLRDFINGPALDDFRWPSAFAMMEQLEEFSRLASDFSFATTDEGWFSVNLNGGLTLISYVLVKWRFKQSITCSIYHKMAESNRRIGGFWVNMSGFNGDISSNSGKSQLDECLDVGGTLTSSWNKQGENIVFHFWEVSQRSEGSYKMSLVDWRMTQPLLHLWPEIAVISCKPVKSPHLWNDPPIYNHI